MPINANVTNQQITASVGETQIDVSVSGGVGPTGSQGPQGPAGSLVMASANTLGGVRIGSGISIDGNGVISVSTAYAAISHAHGFLSASGTLTDGAVSAAFVSAPAVVTSSGFLRQGQFGTTSGTIAEGNHTHALSSLTQSGATTNQVAAWNGTAWAPATVTSGSSAWADITGKPTTASGFGITDAVVSNDARLTDSREWSADTVSQEEAEAGSATTRRAWTAQRVWQSANAARQAWIEGTGDNAATFLNNLYASANFNEGIQNGGYFWPAAQVDGLSTVATSGSYDDLSDLPTLGGAASLNVGSSEGTVAAGDDARLSDARTPTAHNHAASEINSGTLDAARLPLATTGAAGAVIVGSGLSVSSGTVSITNPRMAVRSDTVSSTIYTGQATPGSATSASVWKIRRTILTSAGAISSTATATNVAWDDRLTATYS